MRTVFVFLNGLFLLLVSYAGDACVFLAVIHDAVIHIVPDSFVCTPFVVWYDVNKVDAGHGEVLCCAVLRSCALKVGDTVYIAVFLMVVVLMVFVMPLWYHIKSYHIIPRFPCVPHLFFLF